MSGTEEGRWLEGQSQYGGSGGQPFTGASRDFIVTPMTGHDPMCVPESVQVPCPDGRPGCCVYHTEKRRVRCICDLIARVREDEREACIAAIDALRGRQNSTDSGTHLPDALRGEHGTQASD